MINADRLETVYLSLPVGLRRLIPDGWRIALRNQLLPEWRSPEAGGGRGRALEDKLWGGFSRSALTDLRALRLSFAAHPRAAAQAAWVLARWQATQGDYTGALENIVLMRLADPASRRSKRQYLQEAKLLCLLGRGAEARALLRARGAGRTFDPSVALMIAGSHGAAASAGMPDETAALEHINAVFRHFGLAEIGKRAPDRPLSIDNLAIATPPRAVAARQRVSVIVPAHDAAGTLATALTALAEQSWDNLEVLVVDDASTDATSAVAAAFAARDPRFRLIRQPVNGGSYVARNRALAEATGDFVTLHDADDWSHPEKIRLQAECLARDRIPHNFTAWTRTLPDLTFIGTAQATRTLVSLNLSSHMIRRDVLIAAGGWDHIRVTGDTELAWRLEALAGRPRDAFRGQLLLPACPLAFGRVSAASLTGTEATHVLSIHHGARREYREAAEHWHGGLRRGGADRAGLAALGAARFPAPPALRPERVEPPPLDLLVIGDFNLRGGTFQSAMAMLRAGGAAGLARGLLQYRRYDLDVAAPLRAEVRDFAQAEGVRVIAPGERLRARIVLFTHPPLAEHAMDRFPKITHDTLVVVVNQMAARDRGGTDIAYDPVRVRAHLAELLGTQGLWAPISARVRAAMAADPRYPPALADTWTPLIDTDLWCARDPVWRGDATSADGRVRPVLGRHGRDHPLKWPGPRADLRAAYCADRPCAVRFLGGAAHARARAGRWPSNWHAEPFGARDPRDFLADLDFFLHYPHADYFEEFGRAPMEAMAVGVPVILPPDFAPTFGAAALYAEPDGVWPLVQSLWHDRAAWEARAAAGRAFVHATCGYDAFAPRLARLAAGA